MRKVLVVVPAISAAITLGGCAGLIVSSPQACDFGRLPTKTELLKERGQPDEIKRVAENEEIWTYYVSKDRWCGIAPAWGVLLPLLLPICNEYDQFAFVGDESKKAQAVRIVQSGAMVVAPSLGGAKMNHGC